MPSTRIPYRVSRWDAAIESASRVYVIDYCTLAAIIDRESLGGDALIPPGPAGVGDNGHGRGLCQIDDRYHAGFIAAEFYDGAPLWTDPAFNIMYGGWLLRKNLDKLNSDYPAAIAAYNAGLGKVKRIMMTLDVDINVDKKVKELDALTTGGNYVSDVLRRRDEFMPIKVFELEG